MQSDIKCLTLIAHGEHLAVLLLWFGLNLYWVNRHPNKKSWLLHWWWYHSFGISHCPQPLLIAQCSLAALHCHQLAILSAFPSLHGTTKLSLPLVMICLVPPSSKSVVDHIYLITFWNFLFENVHSLNNNTKQCLFSFSCIVTGYSSMQQASLLRELTCHIGSHNVTCQLAEVTFLPLPQP